MTFIHVENIDKFTRIHKHTNLYINIYIYIYILIYIILIIIIDLVNTSLMIRNETDVR